jgi:hypothetical protein
MRSSIGGSRGLLSDTAYWNYGELAYVEVLQREIYLPLAAEAERDLLHLLGLLTGA